MIARRTLLLWPAVLVAACSPPPPPPPLLDLTILGGADQNPDAAGHARSVALRLFELANPEKFQEADVFALTDREHETLGTDELGSQEIVIRPGETKTLTRALKPGVRYIGVAVLFHDIDRARWRALTPVAAHGASRRVLRIAGRNATLAPA